MQTGQSFATQERKSYVQDSYNILPLTYSASSQNVQSMNSNSPIKSSLHLPLYNNQIQSSTYSFSKPQNNHFAFEPHIFQNQNRIIHHSYAPLSPRTNNSNFVVEKKVQTQLPPSYQILNNQQNYVFNNRSSLKSLSNRNQHQNNIPTSQISGSSRDYQRTFTFQPSQFGSQIRQTGGFRMQSAIQNPPQYNIPKRNTQIYEINPQQYQYRTFSIPPISQGQSKYNSQNLFEQNNASSHFGKQNLQQKLMNRQLTDIKSSYGQNIGSSRHILNTQGVQSFPLKFDSHLKQEKDFTGCCGCKGKRITYESAQKTPFC